MIMKKHSLMLCIFLLVACFLFSGCENTLTETSTPDVSESVEFTENEEDESSEEKVPGDEENDEDDHGASETDEPTPFFEDEEDDFDEEWEKISEEDEDEDEEEDDEDDEDLYSEDDENEDEENADNEKEEIHASASSPRRFSHEQRMQLIDDKLKENGTEEYHIFDAVRLIFEEEVLTGFCNES